MSENKGISLLDAAQSWDIDTLKRVVEAGTCINDHDEEGKSALYYSAVGNRLEHVKLLLEKGANASEQNINSIGYATSPLIEVSKQGHTEVASCLVEAGADMNYGGYNKCTPLWWAVLEKHQETAVLLIGKGANVNVVDTDNNTTPLLLACNNGLYEVAVKLLEHGADPDIPCRQLLCTSTLHASIVFCYTQIVKLLLKHQVKIQLNEDGETPLEYACRRMQDFEFDNTEKIEEYRKIISMLEKYDEKKKKKESKDRRLAKKQSEEETQNSASKRHAQGEFNITYLYFMFGNQTHF